MQAIIRRATESDLLGMYRVTLKAHDKTYDSFIPPDNLQRFRKKYTFSKEGRKKFIAKKHERLHNENWQLWVAEQDSKIVGFTLRETIGDEVFLQGLFVDPVYAGQGLGTALFEMSLTNLNKNTKVKLLVIENNLRAQQIYIKHRFKNTGRSPKSFYGAPQIIMEYIID